MVTLYGFVAQSGVLSFMSVTVTTQVAEALFMGVAPSLAVISRLYAAEDSRFRLPVANHTCSITQKRVPKYL